jgi:hypothetical protein
MTRTAVPEIEQARSEAYSATLSAFLRRGSVWHRVRTFVGGTEKECDGMAAELPPRTLRARYFHAMG